jgi:hypothetical protein
MRTRDFLRVAACAGICLLVTAAAASAQNLLANPSFEDGAVGYGAPGWITFGNGYTETWNDCIQPFAGDKLMKMFGTFSPFGVSGIFQEFPAAPGEQWTLSSHSRHCAGDPMLGDHVNGGNGNWVVQKLAFFDAAHTEIAPAAVESIILDGSFAVDTWFTNAPIVGVAPEGCAFVQAFVLYLQPGYDGGAAQIDDVALTMTGPIPDNQSSWGAIKSLY